MRLSRTLYAAVCLCALFGALQPLEATPLQILANHVPGAVRESTRAGVLPATSRLQLAIGLPLRNREELTAVLQQLADPQSPGYRRYLTADEFAQRFGPTQEDYDKLAAFAEANGLTVARRHANRMLLDVSGPVAAINQTFHVTLTVWNHRTHGLFYAPDREPSLETEVAVLDVAGLDNLAPPKPMDVQTAALDSPLPLTTGSGPSGLFRGADFRAAYAPSVSLTGFGQTIGLVEFDGFYAADVTANFEQAGLPSPTVSTVLLDGFNGAPGASNIEVILDIAMAGYMAPGAAIIVYEGYYPNDVLNRMATDNSAQQLSCSWGYGINSTTEQIFLEMIAQGQTFFSASGDSGAYSAAIMSPADDPNVTSVGATALTTASAGGAWLAESAWSGSGGGVSTTYAIPDYQKNTNMAAQGGSNTMRNIPDVALTGAVQLYLVYNNGQPTAVGGTSAATPLWAAFNALINQQAASNKKPAVGFLNTALYTLANGAGYAAALHDITAGSNGFAALPGFDLTTGWGSPAGQALINTLSSTSSTPSFALSAAPNPVSVTAGSNATSTIQVTAENGFSGAVSLSLSGLPAGVTGSFGSFNSGASTLTLTAAGAASPGSYTLAVNGAAGSITATVALNLTVTAAPSSGYSLTASNTKLALNQSTNTAVTLTVVPTNGFNGTVALTVSGLPSGVTAAFSPATTATTSTLTLTASATAAVTTGTITVTAKSGSLSASVAIGLTLSAPAPYVLSPSAPTISLLQGSSATNTVTVSAKAGFTSKVTLAVAGLPTGVTVGFNPASTSTSSVATFTATNAAAGTSVISVLGTSGAYSSSSTLTLTIKSAAGFTLAATPATLSINAGSSGTTTLAVTALNGFTGTPAYTVAGLPTGVTAAFTGNTLKLTASASAAGTATLSITGTSGALTAQTTVALTVVAGPNFKLSSSVASLSLLAGTSGTATITVSPLLGFSAAVALTASNLPAGMTASFSPASATTTSTLTLSTTSAAAGGTTQMAINGTSGALAATLLLAVTVTVTTPADFTIALTPASLSIVKGGKGASGVAVTALGGFSGSVTVSASSLPTGVTAAFSTVSSQALGLFTVSTGAAAGLTQVTLTAVSGNLTHTAMLSLTVVAAPAATAAVDLSTWSNVPASAVDHVPFTNGGLDGGGRAYSGALLGASQTLGGVIYAFGPMGSSDAVSGQTVTLPAGQYALLKMLATGLNGGQTGQTFTVTYTDGTTSVFTQNLSDWSTPANYAGETKALPMSYRDNSTGTTDGEPYYLYGYSFALNGSKTVKSIALPQNRNVVVLAITVENPPAPVDLSKKFNGIGITTNGRTFTGGLDGIGNAYSGTLLQTSETLNGVAFALGAPDQVNVVSGTSSAIAAPAGNYTNLHVLATGVNGAQPTQTFKVTYTDGATTVFTQSLSDWFTPAGYAGEVKALAMPYRNVSNGAQDNRTFAVYQYSFALNTAKIVSTISLPSNSNVKVFALVLTP